MEELLCGRNHGRFYVKLEAIVVRVADVELLVGGCEVGHVSQSTTVVE